MTQKQTELFALVNREARLHKIAFVPRKAREAAKQANEAAIKAGQQPVLQDLPADTIVVLPGVNVIDADQVKRSGFDPRHYRGRVEALDVLTVPVYQAVDLAGVSTSRRSLRAWLAAEHRAEVRAAIEARLAAIPDSKPE